MACTSNASEASSIAAGCVEGLMRAARREAGLAGSALVLRTLAVDDASHEDVAEELLPLSDGVGKCMWMELKDLVLAASS